MRRIVVCSILTALLLAVGGPAFAADGEFKPLFNGKDLEGWSGSPDFWSVEDGVIVGSSDVNPVKRNTFLATKDTYKNFVLKVKFKLRNGNSGVQYRSKQFPDHVVKGYQADIADNHYMGILYEEGGRGILKNVTPKEVQPHVKKDDWNEYVITADGPKLTQALNGFTTVDYTETDEAKGAKEGIIALQLHAGPKMRIEFKDIEIKVLP